MDFGIITKQKKINKDKRIKNLIFLCEKYNISYIVFRLENINFKRKIINGLIWKDGNFEKYTSDFPKYLYNFQVFSNKEKVIFNELCKFTKPLISYIGGKNYIYKNLNKLNYENLIPFMKINSIQDIQDMLKNYGKLCIKPTYGRRGRNIHFIYIKNQSYIVKLGKNEKILEEKLFYKYCKKFLKESYICQKYIHSKTIFNQSFDLRVHIQKISTCDWEVSHMYARISTDNKNVSNISKGGHEVSIQDFFSKYYSTNLESKIIDSCTKLCTLIDKFEKNDHLDLGLDIGIDENLNIWLFEINSRPGLTDSNKGNLKIAENVIKYVKSKLQED
ncbi:MAG: YheC/YheD family protein [Bacilli bacterium]